MPDDELPVELNAFLDVCIDEIVHLEALLLLQSMQGDQLSVTQVATRLHIHEDVARRALAHLAIRDLATRDRDNYRFDPKSMLLSRGTSLIADYYRTHLIPITHFIHKKKPRA